MDVFSEHGLVYMAPPANKVPYLMKDSWAATKTANGLTGESAQTHVVETTNSEQNSRLFEKNIVLCTKSAQKIGNFATV